MMPLKKDELCVVGYMRSDSEKAYYSYLKNNGFTQIGQTFYFYYYAIKDGLVYSHHHDIDKAKWLRVFVNDINKTDSYVLEPFLCKIQTKELVSKADLVKKLNGEGFETKLEDHCADFYYMMGIEVTTESVMKVMLDRSNVVSENGNDSFSPHSPKVLTIGFIENPKNLKLYTNRKVVSTI